jgi:hypothetical protein
LCQASMILELEGRQRNLQAQNPYNKEVQVTVSPKRRWRADIGPQTELNSLRRQSARAEIHLQESFQRYDLYLYACRYAIMAV